MFEKFVELQQWYTNAVLLVSLMNYYLVRDSTYFSSGVDVPMEGHKSDNSF